MVILAQYTSNNNPYFHINIIIQSSFCLSINLTVAFDSQAAADIWMKFGMDILDSWERRWAALYSDVINKNALPEDWVDWSLGRRIL